VVDGTISLSIAGTYSVRAKAFKEGASPSATLTSNEFVIELPTINTVKTPTIDPNGGAFEAPKTVTFACATAGAEIRYTTDGTVPTATSTLVPANGKVTLTKTGTYAVKARAFKTGLADSEMLTSAVFSLTSKPNQVAAPLITPEATNFTSSVSITMTSATPDATIRYTLNGVDPTATTGTVYEGPVKISATTEVRAIAVKADMTASDISKKTYIKQSSTKAATPAPSVPSGSGFTGSLTIALTSATSGASIFYTTNGDIPTALSTKYTTPITITKATTIKAVAIADGLAYSDIMTASYTVAGGGGGGGGGGFVEPPVKKQAIAPTANPGAGKYNATQNVALSSKTEGASIFYTIDGTSPSASSTKYSTPIIVDKTVTIKAVAIKSDMKMSDVATFAFTIEEAAPDAGFTDVSSSDWFAKAVKYVADNGLFGGVGDNRFAPNDSMTRGMFVTVLNRLADNAKPTTSNANFGDVNSTDWFAQSVQWAVENGIAQGMGNNKFAPNDSVTREQLCVMLARYLEMAGIAKPAPSNVGFNDALKISTWAVDAVELLSNAGIVLGDNNGNFNPQGEATRAEVAEIFYRLAEYINSVKGK
ncbi:MAG: chitobiase/beta-hexosaminidase C-terminal domain-containing protein, partial [Clostridia bacterium]